MQYQEEPYLHYMGIIKVSAVSYANTFPFIYGLENTLIREKIVLQKDYPALCAMNLLEDKVDIGLVPIIVIPELDFYEIKPGVGPDGTPMTNWNPKKAMEQIKDVPVDEFITNLIRKILADLEGKGKLTDQTISLYEKFVVMYQ